jgi:TonB family protein
MDNHELDPSPCELDAATLQRLSDLVGRAHARTSATGVAIALVEDNELVTCAASGASAPEVGTRSPIQGSFSGRCAATGEMLICADVMQDGRVNGEACAAAGIHSIVMVPVSENGKSRGVLGAFSDRANSFSPSQLTVLNTFAEITNELLHHRDQATSGETPAPVASVTDPSANCETVLHDVLSAYEADRKSRQPGPGKSTVTPFRDPSAPVAPPVVSAPSVTSAPAASTQSVATSESKPDKFGPQIVRPTATTRGGAATKMATAPEWKPFPEPPKTAPGKPQDDSDLLSFAADPMPVKAGPVLGNPKAERSSPMPDNGFLSGYEAQHARSGSGPVKFIVGGVAVLVLAGAVFGFSRFSHRASSFSAADSTAEVASAAAPVSTPDITPQPAAPAPEAAVAPKDASVKETSKAKLVDESQPRNEALAAKDQHKADTANAEPLFIRTNSAKKPSKDMADVQAPALMAGLGASKMPQMNATVVPPSPDFPIASVTAPKLINGPRPSFPAAANTLHLAGDTVVLNAKVMINGKIGNITVLRGHPVFVQAVKEAVKRWQYTPATLDHKATEATVEIVFKFGQGQ